MASKWELQHANSMKKILLILFMGILPSVVWSQSSGALPPSPPLPNSTAVSSISLPSLSLPPPPPPPNPASLGSAGSPLFDMLYNNIKYAQPQASSDSGLNISRTGDINGSTSSATLINPSKAWQLPKSFESSIQGLQFIKSNPSK